MVSFKMILKKYSNHWLTHAKQIFVFICLNSFITSAITLAKDIHSFLGNIISEVLEKIIITKLCNMTIINNKSLCYSLQRETKWQSYLIVLWHLQFHIQNFRSSNLFQFHGVSKERCCLI